MKHVVPTELLNKVLNYLATKSYSEVAPLIKELHEKSVVHQEEPVPLTDSDE